ncbi:MAG: Gldg family protein [Bdellovibrionales bacterium]
MRGILAKICWFLGLFGFFSYSAASLVLEFESYSKLPLAFSFVFLFAAIILEIPKWWSIFKNRKNHQLIHRSLNSVLFLSFTILLIMGLSKVDFEIDLTKDKLHSLSPRSTSVLKSINKDLSLFVFFDSVQDSERMAQFKNMAKLIKKASDKISIEIYDLNERPSLREQLGVSYSGELILKTDSRELRPKLLSEEALINSIIRIGRKQTKNICYLQSGNTIDLNGSFPYGASQFKAMINDIGFNFLLVNELDFLEKSALCHSLFIIGAKKPLSTSFIDQIYSKSRELLFLIALDPGKQQNISKLSFKLGVRFDNQYIVDPLAKKLGENVLTAISKVESLDDSFLKDLRSTFFAFPVGSSLSRVEGSEYLYNRLLQTGSDSFSSLTLQENMNFQSGINPEGPFDILVESRLGKEKHLFIGDADIFTNRFLNKAYNRDLLYHLTEYVMSGDDEVRLDRKSFLNKVFVLTETQASAFVLGVVLPPFVIFSMFGLFFWLRRRSKH